MKKIKTIIADDEPKARKRIQRMLQGHEEFELIKICPDGNETLNAIKELNPDLVFLDIQMPGYDGFALLEELDSLNIPLPKIVFITAYDEYALQAFEVHAVDYLMKPFDTARFDTALEKVKKTIRVSPPTHQDPVHELLRTIRKNHLTYDRLMIKEDGKLFFLDTSGIEWIESAGNYIKIMMGKGKQYMVRDTMKNIETKLDPKTFFRIHRSTIININHVKVIEPWFHGDYQVIMHDGSKFNMSRNYKRLLEAF